MNETGFSSVTNVVNIVVIASLETIAVVLLCFGVASFAKQRDSLRKPSSQIRLWQICICVSVVGLMTIALIPSVRTFEGQEANCTAVSAIGLLFCTLPIAVPLPQAAC